MVYWEMDTQFLPSRYYRIQVIGLTIGCTVAAGSSRQRAGIRGAADCAMRFCATCGRPDTERGKVCSGCGGSLTRSAPPGVAGGRAAGRRTISAAGTPARIALVILVVVVLAAGAGTGIWLAGRHQPSPSSGTPITAPSATEPASPGLSSSAPSSPSASPATSSPSTAGTTSDGALTITAAAEQDPAASSVGSFLNSYFSAINTHDYQSYLALLSPQLQQGMSQASFDSGYAATADSRATLVAISAANGDVVAQVRFTSHQDPNAGNHEESCTKWRISLFLEGGSGGYLIDPAPPGYHAGSAACA
jgi:hypothetical protein